MVYEDMRARDDIKKGQGEWRVACRMNGGGIPDVVP